MGISGISIGGGPIGTVDIPVDVDVSIGASGGGVPDPGYFWWWGLINESPMPIIGGSITFTLHATPIPLVTFLHGGGIRTAEIPTGFCLQD